MRAYRCDKCGRFGVGASPLQLQSKEYVVTLRSKAANIYQVTPEWRIVDDSGAPDLCPKCLSQKIAQVCQEGLMAPKGKE